MTQILSEALGNLAESERKKEMQFGSMLEEFSGVEGFDGDFFNTVSARFVLI